MHELKLRQRQREREREKPKIFFPVTNHRAAASMKLAIANSTVS